MDRLALTLLLLPILSDLHAARSTTDSLEAMADRLSMRMARNQHERVAVIGIGGPQGEALALGDQLAGELTFQLARQARGYRLVERTELEVLLQEHRLSASGLVNGAGAIRLGELASASAILTGRLLPLDKRHVVLELKLLHTESGLLEGMERSVLEVPEGFDGTTLLLGKDPSTSSTLAQRRSAVELHAGAGIGDHFGHTEPLLRGELWLRSGRWSADLSGRVPGRIAIGIRAQFMPSAGGNVPSVVEFGHFTRSEQDPFAAWDPFAGASQVASGDFYLVPAGDLSYGVRVVQDAMGEGSSATWDQVHVTNYEAMRWSFQLPVRWYLAPPQVDARAKLFLEAGAGVDLVAMAPRYTVTSLTGNSEGLALHTYTTDGPIAAGSSNMAVSMTGLLGIGVEWGRFSLNGSWQGAFHGKDPTNTSARFVKGDPIGIALLNGKELESTRIMAELEAKDAVLFGNTGPDAFGDVKTTMDRFLDRSFFSVTLGVRIR